MPTKTAKRPVKSKKKTSSRKKQQLECSDCGLVLSVDEMCGCGDLGGVMCCGAPMKAKRK